MIYVVLFAVEIVLGACVGFILSDNKRGLSLDEIKFSSIMFLLANAFVFWKNPDVPGIIFAHMAVSWFVLILGVLIGEMIKIKLIKKMLRTIQKKDIQLAINEFVQLAGYMGYRHRGNDMVALEEKLDEVHDMLDKLASKSYYEKNTVFLNNLRYLHELCDSYAELSMSIWQDTAQGKKSPEETISIWMDVGEKLKNISWDTLNHAEEHMVQHLSRVFPFKLVRQALHK